MPFQKGKSGNPGGRPKAERTIAEIARIHGPEMVKVLHSIAVDGKSDSSRASAASALLDRGYGRPPQFSTGDAEQFRRAIEMSDDELATIAAGESARSGNGVAAPSPDKALLN